MYLIKIYIPDREVLFKTGRQFCYSGGGVSVNCHQWHWQVISWVIETWINRKSLILHFLQFFNCHSWILGMQSLGVDIQSTVNLEDIITCNRLTMFIMSMDTIFKSWVMDREGAATLGNTILRMPIVKLKTILIGSFWIVHLQSPVIFTTTNHAAVKYYFTQTS